jgi:hypothetical protein
LFLILDYSGEIQSLQIRVIAGTAGHQDGILHQCTWRESIDAGRTHSADDVTMDGRGCGFGGWQRRGLRWQHGEDQGGRTMYQSVADGAEQGQGKYQEHNVAVTRQCLVDDGLPPDLVGRSMLGLLYGKCANGATAGRLSRMCDNADSSDETQILSVEASLVEFAEKGTFIYWHKRVEGQSLIGEQL